MNLAMLMSLDDRPTRVWVNPDDVSSLHEDTAISGRPYTTLRGTKICMKNGNSFAVQGTPDKVAKLLGGDN